MSNQKPRLKTWDIEACIISLIVPATSTIICTQIISRIKSIHNRLIVDASIVTITKSMFFGSIQKIRFSYRRNLARIMASAVCLAVGSRQCRLAETKMSVFL